jgi:hypothetical protein
MNIKTLKKEHQDLYEEIKNQELDQFLSNFSFNFDELSIKQYTQLSQQYRIFSNFTNIKEKFQEITNTGKLPAILSELDFACSLSKKGFEIEMIYDQHKRFIVNKNSIKSPDIILRSGNAKIFIEVAKLTTYFLYHELNKYLDETIKNYPISFWIHYSKEYSTPNITSEDFDNTDGKIKSLAKKIENKIKDISKLQFSKKKYEIDGCQVHFRSLKKDNKGFVGGGATGYAVPTEKLFNQLEKEIIKKSNKALKWHNSNEPSHYIIALDLEEFSSSPFDILNLLYGGQTHYESKDFENDKPSCYYSLKLFLESSKFLNLDEEYKHFLYTVGFDLNKTTIINNFGLFISEENKLINITGIIVKNQNSLQYLPNPFSNKKSTDLIKIFNYPIVPKFYEQYMV